MEVDSEILYFLEFFRDIKFLVCMCIYLCDLV